MQDKCALSDVVETALGRVKAAVDQGMTLEAMQEGILALTSVLSVSVELLRAEEPSPDGGLMVELQAFIGKELEHRVQFNHFEIRRLASKGFTRAAFSTKSGFGGSLVFFDGCDSGMVYFWDWKSLEGMVGPWKLPRPFPEIPTCGQNVREANVQLQELDRALQSGATPNATWTRYALIRTAYPLGDSGWHDWEDAASLGISRQDGIRTRFFRNDGLALKAGEVFDQEESVRFFVRDKTGMGMMQVRRNDGTVEYARVQHKSRSSRILH